MFRLDNSYLYDLKISQIALDLSNMVCKQFDLIPKLKFVGVKVDSSPNKPFWVASFIEYSTKLPKNPLKYSQVFEYYEKMILELCF